MLILKPGSVLSSIILNELQDLFVSHNYPDIDLNRPTDGLQCGLQSPTHEVSNLDKIGDGFATHDFDSLARLIMRWPQLSILKKAAIEALISAE